jgi:hypothetical protein
MSRAGSVKSEVSQAPSYKQLARCHEHSEVNASTYVTTDDAGCRGMIRFVNARNIARESCSLSFWNTWLVPATGCQGLTLSAVVSE